VTLSEIGTLIAIIVSLVGALSAFLPQWWARRRVQAEAVTEKAQTGKVQAETAAILVDSTMALAARLDEQILSLISERDGWKKLSEDAKADREKLRVEHSADIQDLRSDHGAEILNLHTELARTQEQLAVVLTQFDECKQKLDLVAFKTGVSTINPLDAREIN
jgi:hypothetical protein